ncbi:hypothetical protein OG417_07880 [Actinoallomurus sp. NBC_01490]|jgi:hypothetical protein|uniref:hypothetical protein n=1 Tax=Actinoallomurus sp. NBC_01490 TaxID=2903557 RepID=UPI002E334AB5|nr:hypothetical protein [Actinoallomurus sp. NBC_01490]
MFTTVLRYAKAVTAAAIPVFTVIQAAVTDNQITTAEWVNIVVAVAGAFGVALVANAPAKTRELP